MPTEDGTVVEGSLLFPIETVIYCFFTAAGCAVTVFACEAFSADDISFASKIVVAALGTISAVILLFGNAFKDAETKRGLARLTRIGRFGAAIMAMALVWTIIGAVEDRRAGQAETSRVERLRREARSHEEELLGEAQTREVARFDAFRGFVAQEIDRTIASVDQDCKGPQDQESVEKRRREAKRAFAENLRTAQRQLQATELTIRPRRPPSGIR